MQELPCSSLVIHSQPLPILRLIMTLPQLAHGTDCSNGTELPCNRHVLLHEVSPVCMPAVQFLNVQIGLLQLSPAACSDPWSCVWRPWRSTARRRTWCKDPCKCAKSVPIAASVPGGMCCLSVFNDWQSCSQIDWYHVGLLQVTSVGQQRPVVAAHYLRMLYASFADPYALCCHAASAGAFARLLCLALDVLASLQPSAPSPAR